MSSQPLSPEEQARHLEESLQFIRQQEHQMRKCLETKGKLLDAIRHASTFLAELRSSVLTPKQYYELYIAVFDALRHLGDFLREDHPNHHLADIYELVQYAGNIVPRLYLMITVGTAYMSIPDAPVREIMKDMMEMCRGVQHPIRGLFLRYYLSQGTRDYLPIGEEVGGGGGAGSSTNSSSTAISNPVVAATGPTTAITATPSPNANPDDLHGNLKDSIQFIITNFIEMNKLWVRLQHQGHSRERDKRTKERQELQILVGSNLVRLSQLEGIDKAYYRESILPAILEQVVQCRDVLAQEYLLDVICQVFPDEFHLYTLDLFLNATNNLNPAVSIKKILLSLINRLRDYASREREEEGIADRLSNVEIGGEQESKDEKESKDENESKDEQESKEENESKDERESKDTEDESASDENNHNNQKQNLFTIFWNHFNSLIQLRPDLSLPDKTALVVGIAKLSLNWYPANQDYIDAILQYISTIQLHSDKEAAANISDLLLTLINFYPNFLTVLSIPGYQPLLLSQPILTQQSIAGSVINSVLKQTTKITKIDDVKGIFSLVSIIIKDGTASATSGEVLPGGPSTKRPSTSTPIDTTADSDEIVNDQSKLAKLVHLIFNKNPDIHAKLLAAAKKSLSEGGQRIKYTYPSLITNTLKLIRRYSKRKSDSDRNEKISSSFKFIHRIIDELYNSGHSELSLRLYINSASIADQVTSEEASYEFFAEAFTVYEESISDSRAEFQALCIIAGALQSTRNFTSDNYDTLVSKCALHASKLLKKSDQCRAVYLASHLWWAVEIPGHTDDALFRDDKRVLECLQRSLRVADACMDVAVSVELFVEILNRYIYYFDHDNSAITVRYINGLINLIQTNLNNNPDDKISSDSPRKHFERTLEYITQQKEVDDKFQEIVW